MKIVIDDYIPYIHSLLEPYATVVYLPGENITAADVADADALIVRTRTRCDSTLLSGSKVRIVATATIGYDHIDRAWCGSAGIEWANAPGCNAPAVAQYVLAAVLRLRPDARRIGIVGVGHVGKIVEAWARDLGFGTLICDPPRADVEGAASFVDLETIAREADVVTFHTPLSRDGRYPSWHLGSAGFFRSVERKPLVINAARGGVIDEEAAVEALSAGRLSHLVIDTWEGEPQIDPAHLREATVATPHIAGYSLQGKVRATRMALDAVCRVLGLPHIDIAPNLPAHHPSVPLPDTLALPVRPMTAGRILASYDIMADDTLMRSAPGSIERLRNTYALRSEP